MSKKTWQLLKENPALFERYFVKEYVIKAVRKFFEARNYHELESPILTDALPQERYLNILKTEIGLQGSESKTAYLIPSTETFNKKILAAGLGNHFVITKVFRGLEQVSPNHSPEFTMLEWYHLNSTYADLQTDTEELLLAIKKYLDEKAGREFSTKISYQGTEIDLAAGWPRISVREALAKFSKLKLEDIVELADFKKAVAAKGYNTYDGDDWQTLFELIFANEIEPNLPQNQPVFVYDFPRIMCPLTKVKADDELVCEKTELYILGKEIANGYTELQDWQEQEKRFKEEQKAREQMGMPAIKFDSDLIEALKSGLPEVSGIGMGLDRLAMLFADAKNLNEINYFPLDL